MNREMYNASADYDGGIWLQVSNCNGTDFLRRETSVRVSRPGTNQEVIWTLPDRLVDAARTIVYQALLAEFQERFPDV